jgi:hypothetical protein
VKLTPHQEERRARLISTAKANISDCKKYQDAADIISNTKDAAWKAAQAIYELHKDALYKSTHTSFDDFCREILDVSKQRAHQLMNWVKTSTIVDTRIPCESQARTLGQIPENQRKAIYEEATKDGPASAAKLQDLIDRTLEEMPPEDRLKAIKAMDAAIIEEERKLNERSEPKAKTLADKKRELQDDLHVLMKKFTRLIADEKSLKKATKGQAMWMEAIMEAKS